MPRKKTNLIDQVFGFLTVKKERPSVSGQTRWDCECECGEHVTVYRVNLLNGRTRSCNKCSLVRIGRKPATSLYDGIDQGRRNDLFIFGRGHRGKFWCTCTVCRDGRMFAVKGAELRKRKRVDCGRHDDNSHMGKIYRRLYPRSYSSWREMVRRCTDPRHPQHEAYLARGIYKRWLPAQGGFENFIHWFGVSGQPLERTAEQSIERIDNTQGYFPHNVCWGFRSEQNKNRGPKYDARPRLARRAAA